MGQGFCRADDRGPDTSSSGLPPAPGKRTLCTVTSYDLDLTRCPDPECGAVAEVVHRWRLGSTSGALAMAHTVCLNRHVFVLPESWLAEAVQRI